MNKGLQFFTNLLGAFALVLGLTGIATAALAADTKTTAKADRKTASKVQCVPLKTPFSVSAEDGYSLEEIKALKNSIFAQYGYTFVSEEVKAEMISRGCLKPNTSGQFSYKLLSDVDKQNVKALKSLQAEIAEFTAINFDKEWRNAEGKARARRKLLTYNYCQVYQANVEGGHQGVIHFSPGKASDGKLALEGMLDPKRAKIREQDDETGKLRSIDSTSLAGLDSTSAASLHFPLKGSWSVDSNGEVWVSIGSLKSGTKLKVSGPNYADTSVLTCEFTK